VASTLNPIFMLGGAPEAYEVSSKTPRVEFQSFAKFLPEAFPIKASDNPEGILKLALWGLTTICIEAEFFSNLLI